MFGFILAMLVPRAAAGGPVSMAKGVAAASGLATVALIVWGMTPFALWGAWGVHWMAAWLVPTAAAVFLTKQRQDSGFG